MEIRQIVGGMFFSALAIGAFVISYLQFQEKGYLFHNVYFWASQEERKKMDEHKKGKRPYYRQSGFSFMLLGIICLIAAVYLLTEWIWMAAAFWISVVIAAIYAVVSSSKIERQK